MDVTLSILKHQDETKVKYQTYIWVKCYGKRRFGFTFSFHDCWRLQLMTILDDCKIMSNTIIFVMIISSIASDYHFENYQSLTHNNLWASWMIISCWHSSFCIYSVQIWWYKQIFCDVYFVQQLFSKLIIKCVHIFLSFHKCIHGFIIQVIQLHRSSCHVLETGNNIWTIF